MSQQVEKGDLPTEGFKQDEPSQTELSGRSSVAQVNLLLHRIFSKEVFQLEMLPMVSTQYAGSYLMMAAQMTQMTRPQCLPTLLKYQLCANISTPRREAKGKMKHRPEVLCLIHWMKHIQEMKHSTPDSGAHSVLQNPPPFRSAHRMGGGDVVGLRWRG